MEEELCSTSIQAASGREEKTETQGCCLVKAVAEAIRWEQKGTREEQAPSPFPTLPVPLNQ